VGTQKHCNNFFRSESVKSGAHDLASDEIGKKHIFLTCRTLVLFMQIARTRCSKVCTRFTRNVLESQLHQCTQRFPSFPDCIEPSKETSTFFKSNFKVFPLVVEFRSTKTRVKYPGGGSKS